MAGLKNYQFPLSLDKIYSLKKFEDDFDFVSPNLFVDGDGTGTVNIYTSEETPANKSEMYLEHENKAGHKAFNVLPNYIYIEENVATVDNVIITGVKPTEVV